MRRIMLTVAYDGTSYNGFALQPGAVTIEGELNAALKALTGEEIAVIGASRTDAGVHAYGNLAVFDTNSTVPPLNFCLAVNSKLPPDIRVLRYVEVPADFHPRHCNTIKTYEYRIMNCQTMIPTDRLYSCHFNMPLDEKRMQTAGKYLVGEHDFSSFCSAGSQAISHVRTITDVDVFREKELVTIKVTGTGFLYNMVRIIAGTLMQIGRGKGEPEEIKTILEAVDRTKAGPTAPPEGLFLMGYEFTDHEV